MDTSGNICTLYLRLNKQTFYQQTLWQFNKLNGKCSSVVDGVNIAKIKTAGSGGANGTHTGVVIRGDSYFWCCKCCCIRQVLT